jgi:RsiW-degrading membrane proteinase PrsW (M82 family)
MVGETTAATMILWGLLLASRGSVWWGGLLVGLAVQTKFVAAIPAAVVVVAVLVVIHWRRDPDRWRRSLKWVVGAMVPTLIFEVSRLATLGWDRYVENTDQIINYSRSVAQLGDKGVSDAMTKLTSLGNMFYTHSFLIVTGAFVVVLALAAFAVDNPDRRSPDDSMRDQAWSMSTFVAVSVLAGGSSLLFWILAVQERSGRHALLGLLLLFPGLTLFGYSELMNPYP